MSTYEALAREHYCLVRPDGQESPEKLARAITVLQASVPRSGSPAELPNVEGVPHLRDRLDDPARIAEFVRRYLPEVEQDERLHALSFIDPLRLATDHLGIAVSPRVAAVVKRGLRGAVSFSPHADGTQGLPGVAKIHWRPKALAGSTPRRASADGDRR